MLTLSDVKQQIEADSQQWLIPLMDFVDDMRYYRDMAVLARPFALTNPKLDALLASTAEYLCDELNLEPHAWLANVPASPDPWFVAGLESLKAIALAESPLRFRIRKIFVLENFLSRV